jgi:hypothetical protein
MEKTELHLLAAAVVRQELPGLLSELKLPATLIKAIEIKDRFDGAMNPFARASADRRNILSSCKVEIYIRRTIDEAAPCAFNGVQDYWEHFVYILAHEYRHIWQYVNNKERTELDANTFAFNYVLSKREK